MPSGEIATDIGTEPAGNEIVEPTDGAADAGDTTGAATANVRASVATVAEAVTRDFRDKRDPIKLRSTFMVRTVARSSESAYDFTCTNSYPDVATKDELLGRPTWSSSASPTSCATFRFVR